MEKISLKDSIRITKHENKKTHTPPPIKGVVIIKDKTGTPVIRKENLVVKGGRELLFFLVQHALGSSSASEVKTTDFTAKIGTGTSVTTELTTSLEDIKPIIIAEKINLEDSAGNYLTVNTEDLSLKFNLDISGTGTTAINFSELGLFYKQKDATGYVKDDAGDVETMFSRVVFDPLPLTSGNSYTLEYYLYF